jgi:DNA-directed RNA polymerase subunit N (RpoN/RPB10)
VQPLSCFSCGEAVYYKHPELRIFPRVAASSFTSSSLFGFTFTGCVQSLSCFSCGKAVYHEHPELHILLFVLRIDFHWMSVASVLIHLWRGRLLGTFTLLLPNRSFQFVQLALSQSSAWRSRSRTRSNIIPGEFSRMREPHTLEVSLLRR